MFRSFFLSKRWALWAYGGGALLLVSLYFQVHMTVLLNVWYGQFYDILQHVELHHVEEYWSSLLEFGKIAGGLVIFAVLTYGATRFYAFAWREAMLREYLPYWSKTAKGIEGECQRLQEDPMQFASIIDSLGIQVAKAFMVLFSFIPILWGLSKGLRITVLEQFPDQYLAYLAVCGFVSLGVFLYRPISSLFKNSGVLNFVLLFVLIAMANTTNTPWYTSGVAGVRMTWDVIMASILMGVLLTAQISKYSVLGNFFRLFTKMFLWCGLISFTLYLLKYGFESGIKARMLSEADIGFTLLGIVVTFLGILFGPWSFGAKGVRAVRKSVLVLLGCWVVIGGKLVLTVTGFSIPSFENMPGALVWVALLVSVGGVIISWFVGHKLPGLEYNNQVTEARLRTALELAVKEQNKIEMMPKFIELFAGMRMVSVKTNNWRLFLHYGYFDVWSNSFGQALVILPYLIMGEGLFTKAITLGALVQVSNAFDKVQSSFGIFIDNWVTINKLRSIYKRLSEFEKNLDDYHDVGAT